MRVLSILPFSPPSPTTGGAERQMHSLHKGLLAAGVEVHVLADIEAVGGDYHEIDGIPVWGVPFPKLTAHMLRPGNIRLWQTWRALRHTVLEKLPKPDLIQATTFRQPALVAYWLSRALNVPWVVRLACSGSHGDFKFATDNWLIRRKLPAMVKSAAHVIALDEQTRAEAISHGVPAERLSIIPNGLLVDKLPGGKTKPVSGQPATVLFLGRLEKQKRIDTLLAAINCLRESGAPIKGLRIVGDGGETASLKNYAKHLGMGNSCSFVGAVSAPDAEFKTGDVFVNPSASEGLPNAVLEAAAFGLPLILSDIPVHREIATAVDMDDFLFPVGDVEALTERIRRFASLDVEAKKTLSKNCAKFAARFTPERRDQAYLELYNRMQAGDQQ